MIFQIDEFAFVTVTDARINTETQLLENICFSDESTISYCNVIKHICRYLRLFRKGHTQCPEQRNVAVRYAI